MADIVHWERIIMADMNHLGVSASCYLLVSEYLNILYLK